MICNLQWFFCDNIVLTTWIYIMLKVKDQTQVMKWNLWKWRHCNILDHQLFSLFYMCALTMFQIIENLWNYMKILHKKIWSSMFPFLQHIYLYNYEHVWFIDATSWTWANKWKGMVSKKFEKLKIGHEEQEIVIKHNFSTTSAIVSGNCMATWTPLVRHLPITQTWKLLQFGASQFLPT